MKLRQDIALRKKLLIRLSEEISNSESLIIDALHQDFKKPAFETILTEISVVQSEIRTAVKSINSWTKKQLVWPSLLNFPSTDYLLREPYGKVLIISPWNYPFQLALVPLVSAIAAGNEVVIKPSEHSVHTSALLQKIIAAVFEPEQAKVILGDATVGQDLLSQKWNYIFFTGSTKVGHIVAQAAAKNLTPITLELGGKNPCIVDASASLQLAAKRIVWGKFINVGQTCIAPDYLLVHESVGGALIELLKNEIRKTYGDDPQKSTDYGRIINQNHWQRLINLIPYGKVVYGGNHNAADSYLSPTLLVNPQENSPLMTEEIFGPILPILTYKSEAELEAHILKNPKPLALYVFSNQSEFTNKIIHRYSFGGGCINDTLVHFANQKLPFGGVGNSGLGAYHGRWGFETFSHKKSMVKKANWLDIPIRYAPYPKNFGWLKKILYRL
ncbi:MAG: aldehyde dehydrogenase [Bacteroidetes bacterium]|nr:aldehyde dehydrogenase [Bacteroidota bacterium]